MDNELENDNSQNVEEENNNSENVEVEQEKEPEQQEGETKEEFTDREKQYFSRIKKLEKELKEAKESKDTKKESSEDVTIARLEARGVLHQDDQNFILKFAKLEGVHYLEALEDDLVKEKLERNKKQRLSASANPKGNNRAPGELNEVASAVKRYEKDGTLPDDNPALVAKVLKAIKSK